MGALAESASMTDETAAFIGISALSFLAEDRQRLARFLSLTGLSPEQLMQDAAATGTLIAVLDHLLADESLLLTFAASAGVRPDDIAPARSALSEEAR
jgi:hypothetical protein